MYIPTSLCSKEDAIFLAVLVPPHAWSSVQWRPFHQLQQARALWGCFGESHAHPTPTHPITSTFLSPSLQREVDHAVGLVMKSLRVNALEQNTFIFFTSVNGLVRNSPSLPPSSPLPASLLPPPFLTPPSPAVRLCVRDMRGAALAPCAAERGPPGRAESESRPSPGGWGKSLRVGRALSWGHTWICSPL